MRERGLEQIGREFAPEAALPGASHHRRSHAGELHAQSVVFEDGDFAVVLEARHPAAHQLADFPDAVRVAAPAAISSVSQIRSSFLIWARADHDRRGRAGSFCRRGRAGAAPCKWCRPTAVPFGRNGIERNDWEPS